MPLTNKGHFCITFFAFSNFTLWSQEFTVRGTVVSALDNEPLGGVSIIVKGTLVNYGPWQ
jgi:hypothetical protein